MAEEWTLLWIGDGPAPPNVREAAGTAWKLRPCRKDQPLEAQLDSARVAVVHPNGAAGSPSCLADVVKALEQARTVGVFLLPPQARDAQKALSGRAGRFLCVSSEAPAEELAAKLAAAGALQPAISGLQAELAAARNLQRAAARHVEDLDEEMRLAARLQRDFLPHRLPEVGPVRFGALFRPASWVSGDIYDVSRLDETHLGFYVVDAVGHGLPAALLTMFIKKGLQTKRIVGNTYQIVPPDAAMTELNADICDQNLSSCQFCSAVYCVLDAASLELTYCRAGHPEPILAHADGQVEILSAPGSLLGVLPEERYQSQTIRLRPGDRLVLYSDGGEEGLDLPLGGSPEHRLDVGRSWVGLPLDELLLRMTARFDAVGGTRPPDDITVLVVDVQG